MRRAWLIAAAPALVALVALYSHRLGDAPAYLNLDEAHFGNHAYSLAATGHDLNGNRLPLFISLSDPQGEPMRLAWGQTWYHPYGFYAIAASLAVLPPSEWSIRLPIALIGVLNVALMFLVARQWYRSRVAGGVAALLLALTPAHFILTRLALDYVMPLPFTLGWLLALSRLLEHRDARRAWITGLILGTGCLSYVSSWVLMPAYLAITIAALWRPARRPDLIAPVAVGFVIALLPLGLWLLWHPDVPANLLAQYQMGETHRSVLTAIVARAGVTTALRDALAAYWSYFNPSFLFVTGGASRLVSTGSIGVWPIGMAVLLAIALVTAARSAWRIDTVVLVAGLLIAPIPAALKGEPFAIQRAITMLPFGVLLAAGAFSIASIGRLTRVIAVIALLAIPWEFSGFIGDYFGAYRARSAHALDPTAFKEVADVLIVNAGRDPQATILLPSALYDMSAKWRFYCTKFGAIDLLSRTRYFSGRLVDLRNTPGRLLVVIENNQSAGPEWTGVTTAPDFSGERPLRLLRRDDFVY